MPSPRLVLLVGSILALPACNPPKDPSMETATEATDSGTDTEGALEVCACIEAEQFGQDSFTCGGWACPMLKARCEPAGSEGCTEEFMVDEAALDCVLEHLIAGEEGLVAWEFSADGNVSVDGGFVALLPDRQALARSWKRFDLAGKNSPAGVVPLKSKEYFEACKAEPELRARFDCAIAWSDTEPTPQCGDGESFSFT